MDYRSLKRKELQALCKKHKIPATSANSVLADKLSALLNEKQKQSSVETVDESEPAVPRRQAKKVRFSPDDELVQYKSRSGNKEKTLVIETKNRRKSVAKKIDKPDVDRNNIIELIDDGVQIPFKLTRSRMQILEKDGVLPVNERKQVRRIVKDVEKEIEAVKETEGNLGKVTRSKVHTLDRDGVQLKEKKHGKRAIDDVEKASESFEEAVVSRVRVTRSKAQMLDDGLSSDLKSQANKRSGRRVANGSENVELSKEIVDIPVRVTRSRGQTLEDNIGNTVDNPRAEKKRTRREVKVADRSNNSTVASSHAASENKQEDNGGEKLGLGGRKKMNKESIAEVSESQYHADKGSRRSRRNQTKVEDSTILDQDVSKVDEVKEGKITRSKAQMAEKSFEGNIKSKTEESLEHAGRKNVNERKSVKQPDTEVALHLEGPVKRPTRKGAGQKFFTQKVEGKGIDKPVGGKGKLVTKTEMVESPNVGTRKALGRKQSKEQSGNLSMIDQDLKDEKIVTRSNEDAPTNEKNAVASATGSHRSRKRRGDPVIEDQAIEIDHASLVDESSRRSTRSSKRSEGETIIEHQAIEIDCDSLVDEPSRRSTRSSRKGEGKTVTYTPQNTDVKKQQQSSIKTPRSRMDNQSPIKTVSVEGQQSGTSRALRSGAIVKGNSSKKRARLTASSHGTKQSDSEAYHAEESNTEEAPVSKSGSVDEKVMVTEGTLAIDESLRRLTRSAIKREKKAAGSLLEKVDKKKRPSQSAVKGQPIGDAQMSIETPRRFTRSGIKHGENTASTLSEKVDKKKQPSQSARKRQPADHVQVSRPEDAEVKPDPDVASSSKKRKKSTMAAQKTIHSNTLEVQSESHEETVGKVLVHSGDLSPSISDGSNATTSALEAMKVECVSKEKSSILPEQSATKCEIITTPHLSETLLSGKRSSPVDSPNFEGETPSGTNLSDIEKTAPDALSDGSHVQNQNDEVYVKSAILSEAKLQTSVNSVETSVLKSARPEAYENSDRKSTLKEMEVLLEQSTNEGVEGPKQDATTFKDTLQDLSAGEHEAADNCACNDQDEPVFEDNIVHQSSDVAGGEPSTGKDITNHGEKELAKELELEVVPSTGSDVHEIPVLGVEDDSVDAAKGCESDLMPSSVGSMLLDPVLSGDDVEDEGVNVSKEHESSSDPKQLSGNDDASDTPIMAREPEPVSEPSTVNNELECDNAIDDSGQDLKQLRGNDVSDSPVMGKDDAEDDGMNASKEHESSSDPKRSSGNDVASVTPIADDFDVAREPEPVSEPSTAIDDFGPYLNQSAGNDASDTPVMGKDDAEDDGMNVSKEHKFSSDPKQSSGNEDASDTPIGDDFDVAIEPEPVSEPPTAIDDLGPDLKQSTGNDASDTPVMGKDHAEDDGMNVSKEHESSSDLKQSGSNDDAFDTPIGDDFDVARESEPVSEPSTVNNILECDNAIDDVGPDLKQLTGNDVCDTPVGAKDHAEDDGMTVSTEHESSSDPKQSSGNDDASDTPISDDFDVEKEPEPVSEPLIVNNVLEGDSAIDNVGPNLKQFTGNDVSDPPVMGKDDAEDDGMHVSKEHKSSSDPKRPSGNDDATDTPIGDDFDMTRELSTAIDDVGHDLKQLTGNDASDTPVMNKDDTEDDGMNVFKEREPDSEQLPTDNTLEIPVSVSEGVNAANDLESAPKPSAGNDASETLSLGKDDLNKTKELEANSKPSTGHSEFEASSMGKLDVPDGQHRESEQEQLTSSDDPFVDDALNEKTSLVPEVLIESPDQEPEAGSHFDPMASREMPQIPATSGDDAQEESMVNSNNDSVANNLGEIGVTVCENVSHDTSNEQTTEETETTTENDPVFDDNKDQTVAITDDDLDGGKFMVGGSNDGKDELDCQLVGAPESLTREESSPIVYMEEHTVDVTVSDRLVGDIGALETPVDKVSDPTTFFKEDVENKQDEVKPFTEETQNTIPPVDWGSYGLEIDEYQNPVSRNESGEVLDKGMKDDRVSDPVHTCAREEGSSPPRKSNDDVDLMKENANVDVGEEFFNWSEDSSLRAFFVTPTTSRIGHLKDSREELVGFSFPDDSGRNGTAAHDFHHQWESEPMRVFNEETQDAAAAQRQDLSADPENEMFRVANFDVFTQQYFDDKQPDGGSSDMSGKNEHFDFKSGEEAGDASGLKGSGGEERQPKGDDLAFDKGTGAQ